MQAANIHRVACVGSGVIGTSWALNFAWKGREVWIYDIGEAQLQAARTALEGNLDTMRSFRLVDESECRQIQERIHYTTEMAQALEHAEFVQESGPESYEIKRKILAQMEEVLPADTVIASSTSGLLITKIAEDARHPERIVGGHPYNPPHLIPLVEIVRGEQSSDEAVTCAAAFYRALGKEPVVLNKEVSGFIANRLQVAVYREAIDLVVNGVCSLEDTDKALLWGPGIRWGIMGPNLIFHLGAGEAGLGTMLERQRESTILRLSQMADWKEMPQAFIDQADAGIAEEIAHLPPEMGKTIPELIRYRDAMLIELLRLHHKL